MPHTRYQRNEALNQGTSEKPIATESSSVDVSCRQRVEATLACYTPNLLLCIINKPDRYGMREYPQRMLTDLHVSHKPMQCNKQQTSKYSTTDDRVEDKATTLGLRNGGHLNGTLPFTL